MTLPKHLRQRWRYLGVAIESWPDAGIDRQSFQGAAWEAARELLGDPGSADVDLRVVRFQFDSSSGTGRLLVRTRRNEVDRARAALACVEAVEGNPVGVRVLGVSGTVRAAARKYVEDPPEVDRRRVTLDGAQRTAVVRDETVALCDGDTFTGATVYGLE